MKFEIFNRDQVDVKKWDDLILNSSSPRIYATSVFLDASTSGKWKAIVFDDYKAVMPVFEKNSVLFKYVTQPLLSQQLGLFIDKVSFPERNEYLLRSINFLTRNFKMGSTSLNEGNWIQFSKDIEVIPRVNFILDLNRPYEKINLNYSKSLRKNLRKINGLKVIKNNSSVEAVVDFYMVNMITQNPMKSKKGALIVRILKSLLENGLAATYDVCDEEGNSLTKSVFTLYGNRITNIFGCSSSEGFSRNSMAFVIDHIIRDFSESDYCFDFEGSDVPGVKQFFERFGPEEKKYPQIFWDKTAGIYSLVKKIKTQLNQ